MRLYLTGPGGLSLIRPAGRAAASAGLLCNQKRSCCLDISIFISFIDFIFMSLREHFLGLLTSLHRPCPLARLGGRGGREEGVRGSIPASCVPSCPRSPSRRVLPQGPGSAGAHTLPRPPSLGACAGGGQPRPASFPSAVCTDLGETWLSPLPRRGSPASTGLSVTVTLFHAGDS